MVKQSSWITGWVCAILLSFVWCGFLVARTQVKALASLEERINLAKESFEEIYYELVKQDFFDTYYNNNLIICTKIDETFTREGEVFLYLIEWLEKRNDLDSRYLLKKLSKYFYVEFYRLVCKVDAQKNQNSTLLRMLKDIYKVKVATPCGIVAPFRAVLSEMIILIFMINLTQQSYDAKREAMAYMLHKIENKFLMVNANLHERGLPDESIKMFIQGLQTYVTKEPLIKPSMVRPVLITLVIIGVFVATGIVVYNNAGSIKDWFSNLAKQLEEGFKTIGKGVADGMVEQMKDKKMAQDFGREFVAGMARDTGGQPNQDTALLARQLGNNVVRGLARDRDGNPNPDLVVIKQQLLPHPVDAACQGVGYVSHGFWNIIRHPIDTYHRVRGHDVLVSPTVEPASASSSSSLLSR